jgi:hypothetical protein
MRNALELQLNNNSVEPKMIHSFFFAALHSAYKWTVDDVVDWLINHVELPQYADSFRINAVDGHVLPRYAEFGMFC